MNPRWARLAAVVTALWLSASAWSAPPTPKPEPAAAAPPLRVGNATTQLAVVAGEHAPRVVELRGADGVWEANADDGLVGVAYVDGKPVKLSWQSLPDATRHTATHVTLVYENAEPHLRLSWDWAAQREQGPLEHQVLVENRSGREIWLGLQPSLHVGWTVARARSLTHFWVDKGAGAAPPIGTHRVDAGVGYRWRGESSTYAHPAKGAPREIIPYTNVFDNAGAGWYLGIEFSGRTAISLARSATAVDLVAGLNADPASYRTRVESGSVFATPLVFLGAGGADVDATGNVLRRWVRSALNHQATIADATYPWTTNNTWGSDMRIDEAQAHAMLEDAHALGFEMLHLDAGWFRAVGDWAVDAQKFPHGIEALADATHALGMKFGLWIDWAQAGTSTAKGAANVHSKVMHDLLTTDVPESWKPDLFKGLTIDLGAPLAKRYAEYLTDHIVRDYHVDMIEHDGYVVAQGCDRTDHPHAPPDPSRTHRYVDESFLWLDGPNSTDVSYHATRVYYDIQSRLKTLYPTLLREICNDGGRMVDFGSAAHGDYFSIVDAYDPVSNRQAFYDASHLLPSAMLETYVKEWPAPRIENLRYALRSGMMGWFTLMLDTTRWDADQHAAARAEVALYKKTLRPLIREADLYHVAPRADGQGWDGIEYFDAKRGNGALYAFRGKDPKQDSHAFVLRGLDPAKSYRLHFQDGSSADASVAGAVLMRDGVRVALALPESSDIVLIKAE